MYLDHIKSSYQQLNPKLEKTFAGVSQIEVDDLGKRLGLKVPAAYGEFLRWFGRSGGNIMVGSDFYYNPGLTKHGISLLNHNKLDGAAILRDAIVIMMHQGYVMYYIRTTEGDDPPVYGYLEGEEPDEVRYETFSGYIDHLLRTEGAPRTSLYCYTPDDLANEYSYDDIIEVLTFNGTIKSLNGRMPDRIFDFGHLQQLDMRYFELTEIDSRIGRFSQLSALNLNGNHISELPAELFDLTGLHTIYLGANDLTDIPDDIAKFTALKMLYISENMLSAASISRLSALLPHTEISNNRGQRTPIIAKLKKSLSGAGSKNDAEEPSPWWHKVRTGIRDFLGL